MARHLSSYSIETDQIVLLSFSDGTETRAKLDNICDLLSKDDQIKVQRGLDLRHKFMKRNLGSIAKYLVIAALVILICYDTARAAQMIIRHYSHPIVPVGPAKTFSPVPSKAVSSGNHTYSIVRTNQPATHSSISTDVAPPSPPKSLPINSPITLPVGGISGLDPAPIVTHTLTPVIKTVNELTSQVGLPGL